MTSAMRAAVRDHSRRRKNFRTKAGLLELPPPRRKDPPVDLGGGVRLSAYGLRRDKDGRPVLRPREVLIPLALLFELGLGPATRARLTLDEARSLPLVKVGDHLWLERTHRFVCCNTGELTLGEVTIPVAEYLVATPQTCHYLPLDGQPRLVDRREALALFAEASVDPCPRSPRELWPPPVPPVAVVLKSDDALETDRDTALRPLLKRCHFALPSAMVCVDTSSLLAVPVIRSAIVHDFVASRTAGGIYHPDRPPTQDTATGRDFPLIVFGRDPQAWSTVAHLFKANL